MALLEIAAVTKVYGPLRALDGVDLLVEAGTFHGLIGPNGSGKSTLLKSIAGAHYPTTGTIRFDGMDITEMPPYQRARNGLSLKFQITAVLTELSVYDNVLLALQSATLALGERLQAIDVNPVILGAHGAIAVDALVIPRP